MNEELKRDLIYELVYFKDEAFGKQSYIDIRSILIKDEPTILIVFYNPHTKMKISLDFIEKSINIRTDEDKPRYLDFTCLIDLLYRIFDEKPKIEELKEIEKEVNINAKGV